MQPDIRLVAKIYRAIQEFSDSTRVDERECDRIADLIAHSAHPVQVEALLEQYAERIARVHADEFVAFLEQQVERRARLANGESDDDYDVIRTSHH